MAFNCRPDRLISGIPKSCHGQACAARNPSNSETASPEPVLAPANLELRNALSTPALAGPAPSHPRPTIQGQPKSASGRLRRRSPHDQAGAQAVGQPWLGAGACRPARRRRRSGERRRRRTSRMLTLRIQMDTFGPYTSCARPKSSLDGSTNSKTSGLKFASPRGFARSVAGESSSSCSTPVTRPPRSATSAGR